MSSFLIPIIAWLPPGYDCRLVMPLEAIAPRTRPAGGEAERYWQAVADGEVVATGSDIVCFRDGRLVSENLPDIVWRAEAAGAWPDAGGFIEFGFRAVDDADLFRTRSLPGLYNVYTAPGRKSFFSCHTWKFGSPQVISQIANFGRYIDAYTVCHVDRDRGFTDSFVFINPYKRPIVVSLATNDGRTPPRIRIEPQSAAAFDMAVLLEPGERRWQGQIQLTANNRVVAYVVKHALDDPGRITTVEHLDPFRADPTHLPWARWLRSRFGDWRATRRARTANIEATNSGTGNGGTASIRTPDE